MAEGHLRGCGTCRSRVEGYRINSSKIKAPAGLKEKLKALAGDPSPRAIQRDNIPLLGRETFPILLALALACAFSLLLHKAGEGVPTQRYAPSPAVMEDI